MRSNERRNDVNIRKEEKKRGNKFFYDLPNLQYVGLSLEI